MNTVGMYIYLLLSSAPTLLQCESAMLKVVTVMIIPFDSLCRGMAVTAGSFTLPGLSGGDHDGCLRDNTKYISNSYSTPLGAAWRGIRRIRYIDAPALSIRTGSGQDLRVPAVR
jgi:hypothetical protein